MRRTRASLTALAAVAAVVLAACGTADTNSGGTSGGAGAAGSEEAVRNGTADGAARGGTLNILGAGDVDFLDPQVTYYSAGYTVIRLLNRQFFDFPADPAKKDTAQPDLAEQLPTAENGGISADGKTYTLTIKQGAQWNTNPPRQVTAADAVVGVKRSCNPAQPFGGLPDFQDVIAGFKQFCDGFADAGQDAPAIKKYIESTPLSGVVAKDDRTVVFTLNSPATYFTDMLALPALSPAPVENLDYVPGSTELGQKLIGNGPYKVDAYEPTKRIELSRNPAWKAETDPIRGAFVDKIVIDETQSQESIQQQLQTGAPNADMMFDVGTPPSQVPGLLAASDPNLCLCPTNASSPYLVYNLRSPNNNKALADVKVRQAISYAINRANIVQVNGGPEQAPPLTHVLPPRIVGSQENDPYPYDPDKAKQMLAEAGYPNGITLKYLYRSATEASSKTFATVQQDLRKAGHHRRGRAVAERRLLHQVPAGARRRAAGRVGHREPLLGRGLGGQRRRFVLQPAAFRGAVVPAERQQLRLLRQPHDQRPDQAGARRDRRAVRRRRVGQGGQAGDGGRGDVPGREPEVVDLPRRPGAQRGLPGRAAVVRPGQRVARPGQERRLTAADGTAGGRGPTRVVQHPGRGRARRPGGVVLGGTGHAPSASWASRGRASASRRRRSSA